MSDERIHGPIGYAYARYDADPRANGPDGFEAFADAVEPLASSGSREEQRLRELLRSCGDRQLDDRRMIERIVEYGRLWVPKHLRKVYDDGVAGIKRDAGYPEV